MTPHPPETEHGQASKAHCMRLDQLDSALPKLPLLATDGHSLSLLQALLSACACRALAAASTLNSLPHTFSESER